MYEFLFKLCILRCLNYVWKKIPDILWFYYPSLFCIFHDVSKICFWKLDNEASFSLHDILANCLLMKNYLNYVWIFIWIMYFKVLELCMKKKFLTFYDFTIRVYFVFFMTCQKYVFDNLDNEASFSLHDILANYLLMKNYLNYVWIFI
jgi:hypothetical protein